MWNADGQLELLVDMNRPAGPATVQTVPGPSEPPNSATERALADILTAVLELDPEVNPVGRCDDFFTLGGDSILAVRMAAQARDGGMPLTPRMVFEHPVLHELAAALDAVPEAEPTADDGHYAPMSTSGLSPDELAALTSSWGDQP